jgi:hypothetical protein
MKHLIVTTVVAYAVLLGAPRNQADLSALALKASLFFAELSVILKPSGHWYDDKGYDAGFDEPNYPSQDA